jgi:hypothetical protein
MTESWVGEKVKYRPVMPSNEPRDWLYVGNNPLNLGGSVDRSLRDVEHCNRVPAIYEPCGQARRTTANLDNPASQAGLRDERQGNNGFGLSPA